VHGDATPTWVLSETIAGRLTAAEPILVSSASSAIQRPSGSCGVGGESLTPHRP
jgi:hypothetical protein